jgi:hypothetical protein
MKVVVQSPAIVDGVVSEMVNKTVEMARERRSSQTYLDSVCTYRKVIVGCGTCPKVQAELTTPLSTLFSTSPEQPGLMNRLLGSWAPGLLV